MWILPVILVIILVLLWIEFRIRKPDQLVLYETAGIVKKRRARFYPRHFSLALPATTHSMSFKFTSEAKGKLPVTINLTTTIAASPEHLSELIRVGGWEKNAVSKAGKEMEILLQSYIAEFCEKYEIEDLSAEGLTKHLQTQLNNAVASLGVDLIALSVQAIEPVDEEIAEAMQQREASRIMEQTEQERQRARVAATKAKIEADEKIAQAEHELEIKKYKLKEAQLGRENDLAGQKIKEELKRRELQLNFDKQEVELLSKNPELLVLSPQLTRLAEASQNLKNAKTVVSLSPQQVSQGSQIIDTLQEFLQGMTKSQIKKKKE
jgi:hypothetical protein